MTKKEKVQKEKRKFSDKNLIRKLIPYFFVKKKILAIVSVLVIFGSILDLLAPYLVSLVIDEYLLLDSSDGILIIIIFFSLTLLFNALTLFVRVWLLGVIGQQAIFELRKRTFLHIQDLEMNYFDENPLGDIISRMTNDLDQLENLFSGTVLTAISSLLTIFGMIFVMFSYSVKLTLITLTVIPLIIIYAYLRQKIESPSWNYFAKMRAKNTAVMAEHISGVRISLSFSREESNVREYEEINEKFYDATMNAIKRTVILVPFNIIFETLGTILVVLFGGTMILTNPDSLSTGTLYLFLTYQTMFLMPITRLTMLYGDIQRAFSSLDRIFVLLARNPEIVDSNNPIDLNNVKKEVNGLINFQNVSFKYKKSKEYVLKDFNLIIQPKQTLAIVGKTGSGKTTIIRLLTRFYEVTSGKITIDGISIRNISDNGLRKHIAVVLQDPFLYSESIRYNLLYGLKNEEKIKDSELQKILESIGANRIVESNDGFDTIVGERGKSLSLGERQLISFARALIVNPEILILDEATSSVDPQIELKIQKALSSLLSNRTSIIIAHRLSTIRKADRIIVLEKGKIVEDGTFRDLLDKKGYFSKIYENYN